MLYNRKRIQNRILQAMYRPQTARRPSRLNLSFISDDALTFLDELENTLEEKITPLLSDLF